MDTVETLKRPTHTIRNGLLINPMLDSIDKLSSLKSGWDGYSAVPICKEVISNLVTVLHQCSDDDINGWKIYPEINGTILLQNSKLKAGIHLGVSTFSYFVIKGEHVSGADNLEFSVTPFVNILRQINA